MGLRAPSLPGCQQNFAESALSIGGLALSDSNRKSAFPGHEQRLPEIVNLEHSLPYAASPPCCGQRQHSAHSRAPAISFADRAGGNFMCICLIPA